MQEDDILTDQLADAIQADGEYTARGSYLLARKLRASNHEGEGHRASTLASHPLKKWGSREWVKALPSRQGLAREINN